MEKCGLYIQYNIQTQAVYYSLALFRPYKLKAIHCIDRRDVLPPVVHPCNSNNGETVNAPTANVAIQLQFPLSWLLYVYVYFAFVFLFFLKMAILFFFKKNEKENTVLSWKSNFPPCIYRSMASEVGDARERRYPHPIYRGDREENRSKQII